VKNVNRDLAFVLSMLPIAAIGYIGFFVIGVGRPDNLLIIFTVISTIITSFFIFFLQEFVD